MSDDRGMHGGNGDGGAAAAATAATERKLPRKRQRPELGAGKLPLVKEVAFSIPPTEIYRTPRGEKRFRALRSLNDSPPHEAGETEPPRPVWYGSTVGDEERAWQVAMDLAVQLLVPLKVDVKGLTLLGDAGTLECFRRAAQSWLTENKIYAPLTFTTQKSLLNVMGRFLMDFVIKKAELRPSFNCNGCAVWQHGCTAEQLRCLHGSVMISREHTVEMDVTSENGQRALKEQPQKTKVVTNRWGRSVVQLRNDDAACCVNDAGAPNNGHTATSCGLLYTEAGKARQAFQQIMAFQSALYPRMANAGTHLLLPVKCECNWGSGGSGAPLLGRQLCKITPFALSSTAHIDRSAVDDPKLLATLDFPCVLVFQCCNPVYKQTRTSAARNCDFKISAPDVITALQLAKQMWQATMGSAAPVSVEEFRWHPSLQYQNTILPTAHRDDDDALF